MVSAVALLKASDVLFPGIGAQATRNTCKAATEIDAAMTKFSDAMNSGQEAMKKLMDGTDHSRDAIDKFGDGTANINDAMTKVEGILNDDKLTTTLKDSSEKISEAMSEFRDGMNEAHGASLAIHSASINLRSGLEYLGIGLGVATIGFTHSPLAFVALLVCGAYSRASLVSFNHPSITEQVNAGEITKGIVPNASKNSTITEVQDLQADGRPMMIPDCVAKKTLHGSEGVKDGAEGVRSCCRISL
eukprot:gnl/TRDRNA2_/TRDRNA2_36387_c0_seq1.p1 gnl/TRDRNA2_/TRDRNA2_36387_c0~~gnl/TRDRNA2_/TRDRNA2_36387_c0_seq1.p1  ORF type:complete len:270 (+),score=30.89 gnl/TRDRNA2_/TRDRNA2_36387_c0_seq1:73-810(+)